MSPNTFVNTITQIDKGARERIVAEVFHFTDQGQVDWAMAHEATPSA